MLSNDKYPDQVFVKTAKNTPKNPPNVVVSTTYGESVKICILHHLI